MSRFVLKTFGAVVFTFLFLCPPAHAQTTPYDDKAAVIFTYFAIGDDENPSVSLTTEQFTQQITELTSGPYTVKPLPEIVDALLTKKPLPPRTVALTFDGADRSILDKAIPLLTEKNLPFTIFIPADKISAGKPPYMTWDNLRDIKENKLASFGLHPAAYNRLAGFDEKEIRRQINSSLATVREELNVDTNLLAYLYGDYNGPYKTVLKNMGFKAAFGQQSGVAYVGDDLYALPRFTLTERYGDMERFIMTANALPFPVTDLSPADPHLSTQTPSIGFTVADPLAKSLKNLSCFSSTEEKPTLEILNNRVEIRMTKPFAEDRPRVNCTLPVSSTNDEEPRWRWLGMLYSLNIE